MRTRLSVAAVVLTLAVAIGVPAAGQQPSMVSGRVEIGIPVASRRTTNTYSRTISPLKLAPVSEIRNVVVYLKDAPRRSQDAVRGVIRQENEMFTPKVVAVPVGSTVGFPNGDPIYHNVFSLSRARTFNLGRYPKGHSRDVRFDQPGIVKIFCDIHSHMSATVMVFDHPWFAVPGEDGRFELSGMPGGRREITAWHERLGETTLAVQVEAGRPVVADFILPVPEQP